MPDVTLPGVGPKNVQIHAQGNTLAISGERRATHNVSDVESLQSQIWYGAFERTLTLPEGVDTEQLNAEHHNGALEITAPISSAALPRRIEIRSGGQQKQMAAARQLWKGVPPRSASTRSTVPPPVLETTISLVWIDRSVRRGEIGKSGIANTIVGDAVFAI